MAAMARVLSKKNLELILMQAMCAAKNVRTQRDRLLELQRRMQRHQAAPTPAPTPADADAKIGVLASDLFNVYFHGLDAGSKMLAFCLQTAVENGAVSTANLAFALMPDEQLYDALLAQRLPVLPTTQCQALARVESALLAVKMLEEHHLPRCVECLVGGRAPIRSELQDPSPDSSPDSDDDPAADAVTEELAKVDLSDDPDATATAKIGGDVEKALDYLNRANMITPLAVNHINLAVTVLSRYLDPKEVARLAEMTDRGAYLGVEISQPTTSPDPPTDQPAHNFT